MANWQKKLENSNKQKECKRHKWKSKEGYNAIWQNELRPQVLIKCFKCGELKLLNNVKPIFG